MGFYYTGIGSRETPTDVLMLMIKFGAYMAKRGAILRSGAAPGADTAFEQGCNQINPTLKEIYLPWENFDNRSSKEVGVICNWPANVYEQASKMASEIHPAWTTALTKGAKALHTRNMFQVLGKDLKTPSNFVVAYATLDKNGIPKGGTRTAVIAAQNAGIKVHNLFKPEDRQRIETLLKNVDI